MKRVKNKIFRGIFLVQFMAVLLGNIIGQNNILSQSYIQDSIQLKVVDADGISIGDINNDGKVDMVVSSGKKGKTYLFEQGNNWKKWNRYEIYSIDDKHKDVEGNAFGDVDNDGHLEVITLDQLNGNIYIHKYGDSYKENWTTKVIMSDRPFLQDVMLEDIDSDGFRDIVYTWQGKKKGEGGIHWLKYKGGNVLESESWEDNVLIVHEGAWWLSSSRLDLSRNGKSTDIIYSVKNSPNRNDACKPGLYWIEPTSEVNAPWKCHVIDSTLYRPAHVDIGNISGDNTGMDIVVGGFETNVIYWYDYGNNWKKHEIKLPYIYGFQPNYIWNVKTINTGGEYDDILSPVVDEKNKIGGLLLFEYFDGEYQPKVLKKIEYSHPMDDRILLEDLTGDGSFEIIIPDSGPNINSVHILKLYRN